MKKKTAIIVLILTLLTTINPVKAEQTCRVILKFFVNNTVVLEELTVLPGESEKSYSFETLPYSLQLVSTKNAIVFSEDFDVNFLIFTDPPKILNETTLIKKIPCLESEATTLRIFSKKDNEIIFVTNLSDYICNKNNLCESSLGESYYNCPNDCPQIKTPIYVYLVIIAAIIMIVIFLIYKIRVAKE